MTMGDALQLRLLGPVRLERDGQHVRGFQSRKAVAALGYLVLHDGPVARDQLVDLYWPELSAARGRANLSVVLHNLAGLLPGCFDADRHTIGFSAADEVWVDTLAFDTLVANGGPAELERAVGLYHGELMAGLDLDGCPDFELWLVSQREAWRERVVAALSQLVEHCARRDAFQVGADWAARLLEIEPWHEEAHRLRMWLLACAGQRSAALVQYEICRRVLSESLGVAPAPETEALVARIRAGEVESHVAAGTRPLASPHPHNLPIQLTAFLGRAPELATIAERLANPACRLLTLVGPGGTGKTRLALEAAAAAVPAFADGAFVVPLAALGSTDLLANEIAAALGLVLAEPDDPRAQLLTALGSRHVLLVLDNFEHLLDGTAQLLDLLRAAQGVKLLVTSRERLSYSAEWLIHVQGLPFPLDDAAGGAGDFPAVDLFAERAAHVDEGFALDRETLPHVALICRLVEGLPLAIELASAWAGDMPCARIADHISQNMDLLTTSLHDVPPRHRSLRVVFEQSWQLLAPTERRALAALSVFRGGFTPAAAEQVAGASGALLSDLVDRQLVRQTATGRHELHELVRRFVAEKLTVRAGGPVRRRHAGFCRQLVAGADLGLQGSEQAAWLDLISQELDNLRAALTWSSTSARPAPGLAIAASIWRFWLMRGYVTEGRTWLTELLAADTDAPSTIERAKALNCAGILADVQGDSEAAGGYFEASLVLYRAASDERSVASLLNNLAVLHDEQAEFAAARRLHEECLAIRRRVAPPRDVAVSLNNLGLVLVELGELGDARPLLEESLTIKKVLDDRRGMAMTLINLGLLAARQDRQREAANCLAESIILLHVLDDRAAGAEALMQLAGVFTALGRPDHGAWVLGAADALREQLGVPIAPADSAHYEAIVATTRQGLGDGAFDTQWRAGSALSWDEMVTEALRGVRDTKAT
jgi:predicted ATPase/DNA-binding SARP family transcriptional activator